MTTVEQPNSTTLRQAFTGYLLAQRARNLTGNYLSLLELTCTYFIQRHSDLELSRIEADHVRQFMLWLQGQEDPARPAPQGARGGKPLSGSSVDIHYRNLKAFFNWCEDEELIARSPMRKVKRPRYEEKLPEALTEHEALTLLDQVKGDGDQNAFRDYVIHLFFMDTGVRLQELEMLNVEDINLEQGYATVMGKGRKQRIVPLGLELRRVLSRYLLKYRKANRGEPALFVNEFGFRLAKGGIRTMIVRDLAAYVQRDLSKRGPHTLRHSAATFNLRATHDLAATSKILGHSTTRTTERYIHLVGADVLRNAEGSPMDNLIRNRGNGNGRDSLHTNGKD